MATITLDGIRKHYGETPILKGVSLDIRDGEFLTLVGPSGCGKSTLLRIIAGLEEQDSGEVRIAGRSADGARPKERDIAMVFQSYALYPHLSVFDNIALPLRTRRLSLAQRLPVIGPLVPGRRAIETGIREEVKQAASMLDVGHLLDRKPGQLSGGQRQRVALGRAMVRQPAAFLMDEPLSNLDAKLRVQMRAEITALHRSLGVTFIYVTHDQSEAMTMSDRVAVMKDGELLQVAPPEELYRNPQDLRVAEMIGSPKINVLPSGHWAAEGVPAPRGVAAETAHLAFRPEAARLSAPAEGLLPGRVVNVENLGSDLYVHVAPRVDAANAVVVRLAPEAPRFPVGAEVGLAVDADHLHPFDGAGRRCAPPARVAA